MTRDPSGDFDHLRLPPGHPLRRHVLYRLKTAPDMSRGTTILPVRHDGEGLRQL